MISLAVLCLSLSARRAWIEIASGTLSDTSDVKVALRKESVDRNCYSSARGAQLMVALRKESVDRNAKGLDKVTDKLESLSARRAWIEIVILLLVGRN